MRRARSADGSEVRAWRRARSSDTALPPATPTRNATATVTPALTRSARPGCARKRCPVTASTAAARRHLEPAPRCVGVAGSFTSLGRARIRADAGPRAPSTRLRAMSAHPRHGDPLRALARPGGLAALAVTAIAALVSIQAADGPWLAQLRPP